MKMLLKPVFTVVVITLVVAPIPPSTIIGMAIIANPKTNKHLDPRALAAMFAAINALKASARWKFEATIESKMRAQRTWL